MTSWTAARQASLSVTNSQNLPKLMSIKSVTPSSHLILCHPLLLSPAICPSIRVFSSESALCIRWPNDWSFSFSISPSSDYSGLISFVAETQINCDLHVIECGRFGGGFLLRVFQGFKLLPSRVLVCLFGLIIYI